MTDCDISPRISLVYDTIDDADNGKLSCLVNDRFQQIHSQQHFAIKDNPECNLYIPPAMRGIVLALTIALGKYSFEYTTVKVNSVHFHRNGLKIIAIFMKYAFEPKFSNYSYFAAGAHIQWQYGKFP